MRNPKREGNLELEGISTIERGACQTSPWPETLEDKRENAGKSKWEDGMAKLKWEFSFKGTK